MMRLDWIAILDEAIKARPTSWWVGETSPVREWRNASDEVCFAVINAMDKAGLLIMDKNMPNNTNEEWWNKEPYMTHGLLSDWFHIDLIIAESRRLARLEMAREMKDYVLNTKDSHVSQVVILALIQEKLDSTIQEKDGKV